MVPASRGKAIRLATVGPVSCPKFGLFVFFEMESCCVALAGLELMIPLLQLPPSGTIVSWKGCKEWSGILVLNSSVHIQGLASQSPSPPGKPCSWSEAPPSLCQLAALPSGFKVIFCTGEGAPVLDSVLGKSSLLVTLGHGRPTKQVTAALTCLRSLRLLP